MSMSDPISDLLTRIRNAHTARHRSVEVPLSRLKHDICRVLREQGFIRDFTVEEEPRPGHIIITLKYQRDRTPVVQGLRRVSKPSLRVYVKHEDIKPVRSGLGISIISTSSGVMTGKQARQAGVGGELLCEVW
jgi:small subunit ribosomal protein S8